MYQAGKGKKLVTEVEKNNIKMVSLSFVVC